MQKKKGYYIYKTTNLLDGFFYIGKGKFKQGYQHYYGSGNLLIKMIKLYGKQNFKKEILYQFETQKEAQIVDQDFLKRPDVYNLQEGGGGYNYVRGYQKGRVAIMKDKKCKFVYPYQLQYYLRKGWQKRNIGNDKICVNNGQIFKMVEQSEVSSFLEKGWKLGNLMPPRCWITKNGKNKYINPKQLQYYQKDGWVKGRFLNTKRIAVFDQNGNKKTILKEEKQKYLKEGWLPSHPKCYEKRGNILITNDKIDKFIKESQLESYLSQDWKLGKSQKMKQSYRGKNNSMYGKVPIKNLKTGQSKVVPKGEIPEGWISASRYSYLKKNNLIEGVIN